MIVNEHTRGNKENDGNGRKSLRMAVYCSGGTDTTQRQPANRTAKNYRKSKQNCYQLLPEQTSSPASLQPVTTSCNHATTSHPPASNQYRIVRSNRKLQTRSTTTNTAPLAVILPSIVPHLANIPALFNSAVPELEEGPE